MNEFAQHSVLVLVPVYNAAEYLPELILRLRQFVCDSNLMIVNDGSTDCSLELLKQASVNYISFPENRGKGAALEAGFDYAVGKEYRSVLTVDADMQHLPEEVPRFFALDDGRTVLIGTRNISLASMPFARCLSNYVTSLIVSIFSTQRVRDSQSGFRLIPSVILQAIQLNTVGYDFESEFLFKAGALGCRIAEVPISTVYEGSHSFVNPITDTLRFIRLIWRRIWA